MQTNQYNEIKNTGENANIRFVNFSHRLFFSEVSTDLLVSSTYIHAHFNSSLVFSFTTFFFYLQFTKFIFPVLYDSSNDFYNNLYHPHLTSLLFQSSANVQDLLIFFISIYFLSLTS